MIIKDAIECFYQRVDLSHDDMTQLMRAIMSGEVSPVLIAAFLVGIQVKGPTVEEVAAAAAVMREFSTTVPVDRPERLIDTCGTGGDGNKTFNISTASAFVVAAAGGFVAKHGGRSVSSSSGSADVLEALGARLDLSPESVASCIEDVGIGFMFAPAHHAAMKFAAPVRGEMGVRTLFNVLGPLTNPAGAKRQVMGVFDRRLLVQQAHVLKRLGSTCAMIVYGENGLDEMSPSGLTHVAELRDGAVREYQVSLEALGVAPVDLDDIKVADLAAAVRVFKGALSGDHEPAKAAVVLNAAASFYTLDMVTTLGEGVALAATTIESGGAQAKLNEFITFTHRD
ncbi:MAG: anthranilate phosphoribosyltransferase [Proteobacteria bacterium]|nr:anthranilate phosphoribosyltransferase [Pseudomonadota bacterium]MDA1332071.1 anthranilate phosphoribosyltransferase [Pseudomonadota bacterium]